MVSTAVIIGIVTLVVVVGIAYVYLNGAPSANNPGNQNNNNGQLSTQSANPALYSILTSGSPNAGAQLFSNASQTVNASPMFNVQYAGKIKLGNGGLNLESFLPSINFTLGYMKYYNDSRMSMGLYGIPFLGNISTVSITEGNNVSYSCSQSAFTSGGSGYECFNTSMSQNFNTTGFNYTNQSTSNSSAISPFSNVTSNFTSSLGIANNSFRMTFSPVTLRSYNGMPCYQVNGTGVTSPSGASPLSTLNSSLSTSSEYAFDFSSCISTTYEIPLNTTVIFKNMTSGNKLLTVSLSETSIGTSVMQSDVITLPGPLQNTTV